MQIGKEFCKKKNQQTRRIHVRKAGYNNKVIIAVQCSDVFIEGGGAFTCIVKLVGAVWLPALALYGMKRALHRPSPKSTSY